MSPTRALQREAVVAIIGEQGDDELKDEEEEGGKERKSAAAAAKSQCVHRQNFLRIRNCRSIGATFNEGSFKSPCRVMTTIDWSPLIVVRTSVVGRSVVGHSLLELQRKRESRKEEKCAFWRKFLPKFQRTKLSSFGAVYSTAIFFKFQTLSTRARKLKMHLFAQKCAHRLHHLEPVGATN